MASLFPMRSSSGDMPTEPIVLEPYCDDGTWMFDDEKTGLQREPFVGDVNGMIERMCAQIPNAHGGFRLTFSAQPFDGYAFTFTWLRADPVEGNWYRDDTTGVEGWLCPALLCYFPSAPRVLYTNASAK